MDNKYGLSEALWDELSVQGRIFFNQQYEAICKYKELMFHPKMKPITKKHWHVIAFNSAYIGAMLTDGKDLPTVLPAEDFPLQPLS